MRRHAATMLEFVVAHLQIKNVPPELHEALRQRAADDGFTLSQCLIRVLEHEVSVPSQRVWLDRQRRAPVISGVDTARAARETREGRERELGRSLDRR